MGGTGNSTVRLDRCGEIGWILLCNVGGLHTIGESFPAELVRATEELRRDSGIRAAVLAGESRVFCAGADLELVDRLREPEFGRRWLQIQHEALRSLAELRIPTIAAVDGAAFGAGFNLALATDFTVASERASFCQAFVKVGLATDMGSPYLLPRRVGMQRARHLMYTGRTIDAREGLEIGVVDELAIDESAEDRAAALAKRLAAGPPLALAAMKRALARAPGSTLAEVLDYEMELQIDVLGSEDFKEGADAFREKRSPSFHGR